MSTHVQMSCDRCGVELQRGTADNCTIRFRKTGQMYEESFDYCVACYEEMLALATESREESIPHAPDYVNVMRRIFGKSKRAGL